MGRLSDGSQNGQDRHDAEKYINDLVTGIQPKFDSEIAELQKLKAAETNDPNAKIMVWDWRYYQNQLNKQKYTVDKEALRDYFPFQKVLDGMFNIYQSIFGLEIRKDRRALQMDRRSPAVRRHRFQHGRAARDVLSRHVPARGKIQSLRAIRHHQRQAFADGKYQRPTVALLCNFPPASAEQAIIDDAQRRGNAVSRVWPRAAFHRHSRQVCAASPDTNVPGDFVEAPSQMLQNWVWDKKVLDTFAADYRDPSKKIPAETIQEDERREAGHRRGTLSTPVRVRFTRSCAARSASGRRCHTIRVAISNPILEKVFLPIDPSTTFVSYFGHLNGYDAGYYGYAWADAIAADMAHRF